MKERLVRLKAVQKLVKTEKIMSQSTLLERLQREGFAVTQATLSRDLKVLNVGKILYFITQGQQNLYKCQGVRLEFVWGKGGMRLHQQKEVSGYLTAPAQEEVSRRVRSIGDLEVLEEKKNVSLCLK